MGYLGFKNEGACRLKVRRSVCQIDMSAFYSDVVIELFLCIFNKGESIIYFYLGVKSSAS